MQCRSIPRPIGWHIPDVGLRAGHDQQSSSPLVIVNHCFAFSLIHCSQKNEGYMGLKCFCVVSRVGHRDYQVPGRAYMLRSLRWDGFGIRSGARAGPTDRHRDPLAHISWPPFAEHKSSVSLLQQSTCLAGLRVAQPRFPLRCWSVPKVGRSREGVGMSSLVRGPRPGHHNYWLRRSAQMCAALRWRVPRVQSIAQLGTWRGYSRLTVCQSHPPVITDLAAAGRGDREAIASSSMIASTGVGGQG